MSDARRYAVWPELKGSRPSVPHGTNFFNLLFIENYVYVHSMSTKVATSVLTWCLVLVLASKLQLYITDFN